MSLYSVKWILLQRGLLFCLFLFHLHCPIRPLFLSSDYCTCFLLPFPKPHCFPASPSFPTPVLHNLLFHHSRLFAIQSKSIISPLGLCTCYLPSIFCHHLQGSAKMIPPPRSHHDWSTSPVICAPTPHWGQDSQQPGYTQNTYVINNVCLFTWLFTFIAYKIFEWKGKVSCIVVAPVPTIQWILSKYLLSN